MTLSISMIATSVLAALQMTIVPIPSSIQYSLTLSPPQQTVEHGSAISVTVGAKNITNHDILVAQYGRPEERYFVDVRDAGGKRLEMTENYKKTTSFLHWELAGLPQPRPSEDKNGNVTLQFYVESLSVGPRIVKPGDVVEEALSLNKLYKFDKPGVYSIQIERIEGKNIIKSNIVTITVTD